MIEFNCSGCQTLLRLPDDMGGLRGKCTKCGEILQIPTAFSAGFMKDAPESPKRIFGPSTSAFGHPGAGGSNAFADTENKISFAYVMNQMEQSLLPNEKSLRLVDALYGLPARSDSP